MRCALAFLAATASAFASAGAAQSREEAAGPAAIEGTDPSLPLATVPAPEEDEPFGAYGITVGARFIGAAGSACPSRTGTTCVLGAGGGLALHLARRWPTGLAIEGGFEVFAHNTGDLFEPGLMHALFGEVRAEIATAGRVRPFGRAGIVIVALGDDLVPSAAGAGLTVTLGTEVELTQLLSISVGAMTRALWFLPFETQDGVLRSDGGIPSLLFGLEAGLVLFPD